MPQTQLFSRLVAPGTDTHAGFLVLHALHSPLPVWSWYRPLWQSLHSVAPVPSMCFPTGHEMHEVEPSAPWYLPTAQTVQWLALVRARALLKRPLAQFVHDDRCVYGLYLPPVHWVHDGARPVEK